MMADQTSSFNIKAVIRETGLNAETLRAWERRYGLPKPERTPGGHRLYSLHDIQILNWLTERQKGGMSISRAVELWRSLVSGGQDPLLTYVSQPQQSVGLSGAMLDNLCLDWVNACLDFDERAAEQVLTQAFGIYSPEVVCSGLIQKGLAIIGNKWYEGSSSVQQEHFASALAMRRLQNLAVAAPIPNRPGRILAVCPAGEQHEFGLLLLTVLLRRRGWEVVYLGTNVPIMRLDSTLRTVKPFLTISVAQTLPSAAALKQLGEFLADQDVLMAYGGGIFNTLPSAQNSIPGYFLGLDFIEATETVKRLWDVKPHLQHPQPLSPEYELAQKLFLELHPYIEIYVTKKMEQEAVQLTHLEFAISAIQQHVEAALALGDINLVGNSIQLIERSLRNYGWTKGLFSRLLDVYWQAIGTHLPIEDQAIFSKLAELFYKQTILTFHEQ